MNRQTLPNRRPCVTVDTVWNGNRVTIGVGFDPATGEVMEAFADAASGADQDQSLRDACTIASMSLQWGSPLDDLERSLGRVPAYAMADGAMVKTDAPASPVGAALAAVRFVADGVANDPGFFEVQP